MSDIGKNLLLWLVIAAVLLTVFNNFNLGPKSQVVAYSDFVKAVNQKQINEVQIQGDKISAINKAGDAERALEILKRVLASEQRFAAKEDARNLFLSLR